MVDGLTTAGMPQGGHGHRHRRVRTAAEAIFFHGACDKIRLLIGAARDYKQLRLTQLTRLMRSTRQAWNPLKVAILRKDHPRPINADRCRMHWHCVKCSGYIIHNWIHTMLL